MTRGVERPVTQEQHTVSGAHNSARRPKQTVAGRAPGPRTLAEKLAAYSVRDYTTGCLIWTRAKNSKGYGCICVGGGKNALAHRVSYEVHVGPIPDGLQIDHVAARGCRSKLCVEPSHLEAVTQLENMRRAPNSVKTRCVRGHALTGRNARINRNGHRSCRTCANAATAVWHAAQRRTARA